jgi:hypothetical protein
MTRWSACLTEARTEGDAALQGHRRHRGDPTLDGFEGSGADFLPAYRTTAPGFRRAASTVPQPPHAGRTLAINPLSRSIPLPANTVEAPVSRQEGRSAASAVKNAPPARSSGGRFGVQISGIAEHPRTSRTDPPRGPDAGAEPRRGTSEARAVHVLGLRSTDRAMSSNADTRNRQGTPHHPLGEITVFTMPISRNAGRRLERP